MGSASRRRHGLYLVHAARPDGPEKLRELLATRVSSTVSTPDFAAIHFFCWAGLAGSRSRDTCGWLSLDAPHGNSARWHQPTHSKRAAVVQGYADGRTTTGN